MTAWSEPRCRRPSTRAGIAEAPPAKRARPPPVERADAVRVEPAAPLPAERPGGRPCLACCAAAGRSTQAGVRVDSCHAAAGRASASSLPRRRRPSARAGVRFELAAPPTTECAGGDLRRFCHTAAGRARESPRRGSFLLYLLPAVVAVGLGARSQRGWRQGSRSGWRRGRHLRWRMRGCRRWRRRRPTSHGIGEDRGR